MEFGWGFFHQLAASQICPHLSTGCIHAHLSLTPKTKGLQTGGCIRGPLARAESLNLLVSSGPVSTRACQMSRAVLGVAGKGQQTSPEICIPCVLSSPGALEEVKGSRRAGGQNQPQAAAISHLRSLASPSLGIFAPCPDALWGVEEQEFRNKVWNCWPLLYQPLTPACGTTSSTCSTCPACQWCHSSAVNRVFGAKVPQKLVTEPREGPASGPHTRDV